jgi:O-antigen/teichoic acid export membrane protein
MVNNTFWPELSLAFGAGHQALLRTLHRRACQMALIVAALLVACMMALGPWFLSHWTGGNVPPSRTLLSLLLLVVLLYALWSTSSTLVIAINRHQRLALWYIGATALTIVLTFFLARRFGLYGAAASLLLSELIMNTCVLPDSLRLTQDTLRGFVASLFTVPAPLHPSALLQRLRRSRPGLES